MEEFFKPKMPTGINSLDGLIAHKKQIEGIVGLHTEYNLITIDGVDGSGKETIAKKLATQLQKQFPDKEIEVIDVTHFEGSPGQVRIGKHINEDNIDQSYVASANRAYVERVWPALEAGKIVVIPRSECNFLRHVLQEKNPVKIKRQEKYLSDGTTTAKLWSGNKIFVGVSTNDQGKMLNNRGELSIYDPKTEEERIAMQRSQQEAEFIVKNMSCDELPNEISVTNEYIEDEIEREKYIDGLVQKISSNLQWEVKHT